LLVLISSLGLVTCAADTIPHLEKYGTATRLIVHAKPFVMIAGELHNSSSSNAKPAALIIQSEENAEEFYIIGQGFEIGFGSRVPGPRSMQILSIDMGRFEDGRFVPELRLNGDESGANWRARIPAFTNNTFLDPSKPRILRVQVHRFD